MSDAPVSEYCVYCGLPIPRTVGARQSAGADDQYCCSGCRFAAAVDAAPAAVGAARGMLLRIGLAIFFTMNVVVFTMELWSRDVYADPSFESAFAVHLRELFQWASLLFSLPVLLLLGGPLASNVWASLKRRAITTDVLILLGVVASYLYSAISVLRGAGPVYFEVGCVVLVFVSLGRWFEARGKQRTGAALDALARLLPETVRRSVASPGAPQADDLTEEIPRVDVAVGDVVRVLPGERLPLDGRIAAGRATLDEQIITGESRTVAKAVGDAVYSGALNLDGDLWIKTTATADDDMVSRMLRLVRDARRIKGRYERLADRIAVWFVPSVCLIAVAAAWRHGVASGVDQGILVGLAVVLIACPCALGLATPMAVWTALGRAASEQVLFRSGEVLERLAHVGVVCFDKTGTLTSGQPAVLQLIVASGADRDRVLRSACGLAAGSSHNLSRAILTFGIDHATPAIPGRSLENVHTHAGRGVSGVLVDRAAGRETAVYLGSLRWMMELNQAITEELTDQLAAAEAREAPLACVAWNGVVRGVFLFREQLRDDAAAAIQACRSLGLKLFVLTGDHHRRAAAISRELGVESLAEQLPADKATIVRQFSRPAAMVGDGLNDAPALAAAEVGVALGCGADLSRDAAGVCLLSDGLGRLPWAVGLARQTLRVVRQNLFWAFVYNIGGIVLAATGRLNPIWAAAAMGVSSVMVIGNSLRLARYGEPSVSTAQPPRDVTTPGPAASSDDSPPGGALTRPAPTTDVNQPSIGVSA